MTIKEALQRKIKATGYSVDGDTIDVVLIDRNLTGSDDYTGKTQATDLAYADLLEMLLPSADVAEADYKITPADVKKFTLAINRIYTLYGLVSPLAEPPATPPTVTAQSPW